MKVCSFVKIIMMNKMSKNHKLLLAKEIVSCNYPKANGKIWFWFLMVLLTHSVDYK